MLARIPLHYPPSNTTRYYYAEPLIHVTQQASSVWYCRHPLELGLQVHHLDPVLSRVSHKYCPAQCGLPEKVGRRLGLSLVLEEGVPH